MASARPACGVRRARRQVRVASLTTRTAATAADCLVGFAFPICVGVFVIALAIQMYASFASLACVCGGSFWRWSVSGGLLLRGGRRPPVVLAGRLLPAQLDRAAAVHARLVLHYRRPRGALGHVHGRVLLPNWIRAAHRERVHGGLVVQGRLVRYAYLHCVSLQCCSGQFRNFLNNAT